MLSGTELLITNGHHRYETARVYQQEVARANHVLMCLVALQAPGLYGVPDARGSGGVDVERGQAHRPTRGAVERDWTDRAARHAEHRLLRRRAQRRTLYLEDVAIADESEAGKPEPYRQLDTAVLESLILTGPLGLSEDDIKPPARARLRAHGGGGDRAKVDPARPTWRS